LRTHIITLITRFAKIRRWDSLKRKPVVKVFTCKKKLIGLGQKRKNKRWADYSISLPTLRLSEKLFCLTKGVFIEKIH